MISKALFKQSCKANRTGWLIITFAVCFMLACVMLISGSGKIGEVRDAVQDTIIQKEIDSQMQTRSINYYYRETEGLKRFDEIFAENFSTQVTEAVNSVSTEVKQEAIANGITDTATITALIQQKALPIAAENTTKIAISKLTTEILTDMQAENPDANYTTDSQDYKEVYAAVLFAIVPNNDAFSGYPADYKDAYAKKDYVTNMATNMSNPSAFIKSNDHLEAISDRAESYSSAFIAHNMTLPDNVNAMLEKLSDYDVDEEKFNSFGYTYENILSMARETNITFRHRYDYEASELAKKYNDTSSEEYKSAIKALSDSDGELVNDIAGSFLSTLPSSVSEALEEIGKTDLYTLVVGSIFYKLAGLLLPIIFMIMASNSLIAGQVDSGSMAYVLSTSTKRSSVVKTQALFLISSLLAMFLLTTATGFVCLSIVTEDVALTYGKLALLNLGAFLVLFALSGLCFFTSCTFDRSKRSMAIGGGLSIFALVAAMLGLFGSPALPSVVRLDSLNYFNYATIISFFDVISIMNGTGAFIWKFCILGALGIIGYIAGSIIFTKKDLPL